MSLKKSDKSKDKKQHKDSSQESGNGSNAENRSLVSIIDAQGVSDQKIQASLIIS